jgi:hypothetical protein
MFVIVTHVVLLFMSSQAIIDSEQLKWAIDSGDNMTKEARQHLKQEALVGGISNAVFNGGIAWWLLKDGPALAWAGEHSFVIDIFATAFLLPFIVALIVIPIHRRKLARGKIATMDFGLHCSIQRWVNRLPQSTLRNACWFGLTGLCLAPLLPLIGFYLAGVEQIEPLNYAIFKGFWAGLMAAVLVIPMVMSALRKKLNYGEKDGTSRE